MDSWCSTIPSCSGLCLNLNQENITRIDLSIDRQTVLPYMEFLVVGSHSLHDQSILLTLRDTLMHVLGSGSENCPPSHHRTDETMAQYNISQNSHIILHKFTQPSVDFSPLNALDEYWSSRLSNLGCSVPLLPISQVNIQITPNVLDQTARIRIESMTSSTTNKLQCSRIQATTDYQHTKLTVKTILKKTIVDLPLIHAKTGQVDSIKTIDNVLDYSFQNATTPVHITTTIEPVVGYHSKLLIFVSNPNVLVCTASNNYEDAYMDLAVAFHLSKNAFIDRFEVGRIDFGQKVQISVFGNADLEVPANDPAAQENIALLRIRKMCNEKEETRIEIPFHLRYQPPTSTNATYAQIAVNLPVAMLLSNASEVLDKNSYDYSKQAHRHQALVQLLLLDTGLQIQRFLDIDSLEQVVFFQIPLGRNDDYIMVYFGNIFVVLAGTISTVWTLVKYCKPAVQKLKTE
ncbi:hypothetical protein BDV3_000628 [Batrachochytrium dendrobatidis]